MRAAVFLFACLVCSSFGEEKLHDMYQPSQSLAMLLTALNEPVAAWQSVGHGPRFQFKQSASPGQRRLAQTSMHVKNIDEAQVDRRSLLAKAITAVALSLPLHAAVAAEEIPFAGVFTDPNNPGSFRRITLTDEKQGGKTVAKLEAYGGIEPKKYTAPALVDSKEIIIDLSGIPGKKGPKEYKGKYSIDKESGAEGLQFPGGPQYYWNRIYDRDGEALK